MLILCIADVERDVGMKNLSPKEAITILEGMRIDIPVPKAAVTQIKRNLALDMAINALNCSEFPNNWIPCSERMPEEREWIGTKRFGTTISDEVYVTFEAPDGQRFADHISFQNGKLSRSDEHRMKVVFKGAKPIAWKPLPEAWKGSVEE